MEDPAVDELIAQGEEALRECRFDAAREAFAEALAHDGSPVALDGLGRALWWLRDEDGALGHRERAYAAFREAGEASAAALIALWLAREYAEALGNEPIGRGWMARAEGLLRDLAPGAEHGWLAFTRGRLAPDPAAAREDAEAAVEAGRAFGDLDLEATGMTLLGAALIAAGEVDAGIAKLDEAMAAATGGEVADPIVFGNICCLATWAAQEAGELARLMHWNQVVMSFLERSGHLALLAFCGACGADMMMATGQLEPAEAVLMQTIQELEATGQRARCVHPAARLAELRLLQGRVEEAERLLAGHEDRPDAIRALATLHLAKGEASVAAALLHRQLNRVGDNLLAAPLLALLVEVQLAQGQAATASETAERLAAVAARSAQSRLAAAASLARGRVAVATGHPHEARDELERAVAGFAKAEMPVDVARARLDLARSLLDDAPELAAREARLAEEAFEEVRLGQLADRAAALVREAGGPARTGPKGLGLLSRREVEVLRLLGEGLTNAEIAARLYISTKTAGNHVSNVLSKLHLRSRQEAAAYAVRYAASETGSTGSAAR